MCSRERDTSSLGREAVIHITLRGKCIRIGHFQVASKTDAFQANLAKFVEGLQRADRVEIVCFPECFPTGCARSAEHARDIGLAADSPQLMQVLDHTAHFDTTAVVGIGELRGADYYNSAAVLHRGHLLGIYRKCTAYESWEKQGREFPVFRRGGVTFGVVICSDGYIEPTRILATKGAKLILARSTIT
jgi:predicted amidohydrolase